MTKRSLRSRPSRNSIRDARLRLRPAVRESRSCRWFSDRTCTLFIVDARRFAPRHTARFRSTLNGPPLILLTISADAPKSLHSDGPLGNSVPLVASLHRRHGRSCDHCPAGIVTLRRHCDGRGRGRCASDGEWSGRASHQRYLHASRSSDRIRSDPDHRHRLRPCRKHGARYRRGAPSALRARDHHSPSSRRGDDQPQRDRRDRPGSYDTRRGHHHRWNAGAEDRAMSRPCGGSTEDSGFRTFRCPSWRIRSPRVPRPGSVEHGHVRSTRTSRPKLTVLASGEPFGDGARVPIRSRLFPHRSARTCGRK